MSIPRRPLSMARRLQIVTAAAGASALLLTGCGGGDSPDSSASEETGQSSSAAATGAESASSSESGSSEASPSESASAGASESGAADSGMTDASQGAQYVQNAVSAGYALNEVGDLPVVTMYTDYECPACQSAHPLVEEAADSLDGEVTVVVKNFPLPMHDNAVPAARAVEAAAMQGEADDYASALYENPDDWTELSGSELDDYFKTAAEEQELDADQFSKDYSSGAVASIVDEHASQAEELGLEGTPSFVVGEESINLDDVQTADDLANAFRDATKDAPEDARTPAGGTAAATAPAED